MGLREEGATLRITLKRGGLCRDLRVPPPGITSFYGEEQGVGLEWLSERS
jgi:hypothetical protein